MLEHCPSFAPSDAERVAREQFGFEGRASLLTSERDQNFCIDSANGTRIVLKIANAREERAMLEAQQLRADARARELSRSLRASCDQQAATPSSAPRHPTDASISCGRSRGSRGVRSRRCRAKSRELLEDFGRSLGALNASLATFDAPAIHRDFYWDLANGRAIVDALSRARHGSQISARTIDTLIGCVRPRARRRCSHRCRARRFTAI